MRQLGLKRSIWLGGTVAFACGGLVAGLAAGAGSGLRYVSDSGTAPPGTTTIAASCPGSTKVLGGGIGVADNGRDIELNATAPQGSVGWTGSVNNSSDGSERAVVHAICAASGRYERVQRVSTIPPGSFEVLQAKCPAGTTVTGGGVDTNPPAHDVELISSNPIDTADDNRRPEDGWRGKVTNELESGATTTVTAICAHAGNYSYRSSVVNLPGDAERQARTSCGGKVTGGGVSITGNDPGLEATASFPQDRGDPDGLRDDGWAARGQNEGEGIGAQELRAHIICKT